MALNTFGPEFFLQELTMLEMFEYPWVALSGALNLSGPGNKLSWPDLEGSVVSKAYVDNADVVYNAMTDKVYSITVNDYRETAFYVTDIERVQRLSSAMANGMTQAMREQLVNLSSVIRTAYRTATRLAATGLTEPIRGDPDGLVGNVNAIAMLDAADATNNTKYDTAEGRLLLLGGVRRARSFGRRHGWPSRFACVAPLEVTEQINALITEDKVNLGSGSIVDSAFATGQVPMIYGCEFHEDTLVAPIATGGPVGDDGGLRMDFIYPGQSVKYITQPVSTDSMRDNDKFRQNGRTLRLNGAGQDAARFLYSETIELT